MYLSVAVVLVSFFPYFLFPLFLPSFFIFFLPYSPFPPLLHRSRDHHCQIFLLRCHCFLFPHFLSPYSFLPFFPLFRHFGTFPVNPQIFLAQTRRARVGLKLARNLAAEIPVLTQLFLGLLQAPGQVGKGRAIAICTRVGSSAIKSCRPQLKLLS